MYQKIRNLLEAAGVPSNLLEREVNRLWSAIIGPSGKPTRSQKSRGGKKVKENKAKKYAAIAKRLDQVKDLPDALHVIYRSTTVVNQELSRITLISGSHSLPKKPVHRSGLRVFCDKLLEQYSTPTEFNPSIFEVSPSSVPVYKLTSSQKFVPEFSEKIKELKSKIPEPQLIKGPEQKLIDVKGIAAKLRKKSIKSQKPTIVSDVILPASIKIRKSK